MWFCCLTIWLWSADILPSQSTLSILGLEQNGKDEKEGETLNSTGHWFLLIHFFFSKISISSGVAQENKSKAHLN